MNDIGNQIASLRKQRGYTIRKLSELTGLNISNLSLIEQGKRQPQIDTLLKIINALDAELAVIPKTED